MIKYRGYSLVFVLIFIMLMSAQVPGGSAAVDQQVPQQPPDPELEAAIERYEALKAQYPDQEGLYYNLGNLKYLKGDYESAQQEYANSLTESDPVRRSESLYNLGNTMVRQNALDEGIDFYRQALELNPSDQDIKYNYEMSKQLLQQQQQQQQQQGDENQENKDQQNQEQQQQQGDQEQQEQQQQESQEDQEQQQQESQEDQEQQKDENSQQQSQEDEEKESTEQQPQPAEMTEEEKLDRQEAEAILNALKANEENLMEKKYRAKGQIKVEKDW